MVDLRGKIVLVTGAAGTIGSAVVQAIKQASGTAIGSDLPGKSGIDTILDVALESDWQRTNADIEQKYGRLDGLVNAAGIVAVGSIEMTDFSAWRRVIDVNLNGTFLACKYAFPLLRKKGGATSICLQCWEWLADPTLLPIPHRRAACPCSPNRWHCTERVTSHRCGAMPSARHS